MTVLGRGDLSPPRRHRRRGRHWWLWLLLLVTLAVAGWFGWQALRGDDSSSLRTSPPCVQPTHPPAPAMPSAVHVRVLNGTARAGLAHDVAAQLRRRGFRITGVGNAAHVARATEVEHDAADLASALAVAEQLRARSLTVTQVRVVTLVIGRDFHALAPEALAAGQREADVKRASPSASPCPTSSG